MKETKKVNTIGITFNLRRKGVSSDEYEEFDEIETIESLKKEIKKQGFKVVLFEQNDSLLARLKKKKPDLVFNIAEGFGATRSRESQVPCFLENLKIPYSGSDPLSLGITLDKYYTNVILRSAGVPVPEMHVVRDLKDADGLKNIFKRGKEFIVKPRWEGSSKGIFQKSLVTNYKEMKARCKETLLIYKQPAVVEEFLVNDEVTVGLAGNKNVFVLGMMRIVPAVKTKKFLYSIEVKRDWKKMVRYEPEKAIPDHIRKRIEHNAIKAYKALELRDVSRIDFRLDKKMEPKIIDVNPLPGLSPAYSDLPILFRLNGRTYEELIKIILKQTIGRHGFSNKR